MENNKINLKSQIAFSVYALVLGMFVGCFIWAFLKVIQYGMEFLWNYIPSIVNIPFYTIIVCIIGGIIIGFYQMKFGDYPESLETVISKVKKEKYYKYNNIFAVTVGALLPLIFGGSVGPEAGMVGIIVGLCYWVGDKLKLAGKTLTEFTSVGIIATLGILFYAPFFGIAEYSEEPTDANKELVLSKPGKLFAKIFAVIGGIGIYYVLGQIFGSAMSFPSLPKEDVTNHDRLLGIPLIIIGLLFGYIYMILDKLCALFFRKIANKKWFKFLGTILGGLALGIIGTYMPITMFSGEEQITELSEIYMNYSPYFLIIIGIVKLFITSFCIHSGWRGGHFFPVIFGGVSIGYGFSLIFATAPSITIAIITAAILAVSMRKPFAVALLLLLCLPVRTIPWLIISAFIAGNIPLPKFLRPQKAE